MNKLFNYMNKHMPFALTIIIIFTIIILVFIIFWGIQFLKNKDLEKDSFKEKYDLFKTKNRNIEPSKLNYYFLKKLSKINELIINNKDKIGNNLVIFKFIINDNEIIITYIILNNTNYISQKIILEKTNSKLNNNQITKLSQKHYNNYIVKFITIF